MGIVILILAGIGSLVSAGVVGLFSVGAYDSIHSKWENAHFINIERRKDLDKVLLQYPNAIVQRSANTDCVDYFDRKSKMTIHYCHYSWKREEGDTCP